MPDLRKDPIVDRWVIISTERGKRPKDYPSVTLNSHRGFCPFCYGNEDKTPPEVYCLRPKGYPANSPNWKLRVVPNKFPALKIEGKLDRVGEGIFDKMSGIGAHEVIIESPEHETPLEMIPESGVKDCLYAYQQRMLDLKKDTRFRFILIFKNHGEAAGASLEHSHSQLIALPIVPELICEELAGARRHYEYKERCIFCDIIAQERGNGIRVVLENDNFIAMCPYAPRFPFETWILPKYHSAHYELDTNGHFGDAANILKEILMKIKIALDSPPYNFVLHSAPFQGHHDDYYHWHIEVMPKITKMAGFEQGTGFYINPTPPEEAAETLRSIKVPPQA